MIGATARTIVFLAAAAAAGRAAAQHAAGRAVLPAGLGSLHHPIRTGSKEVQSLFDQGLTLYYGFNRDAAIRTFAAATRGDPDAAMTHAGLALALGPNLNMDALPADIDAACDAAKLAEKQARRDDERGYAAALIARYCAPGGRLNGAAYAERMNVLRRRWPADPDAAVLYADSLLALRPRTIGQDAEIVAVLEAVLEQRPTHVGANHYYIHAVEGTTAPGRALASAKRLETLVPGIGHLLHMPSHIYLRTGEYEAAMTVNRRAAAADLAYLRSNPPGHDGAMYYLHDLESLAVAAGYAGRLAEARIAALEMARVESELSGESAGRFSAPLAMVLLRFQRWAEVTALPAAPEGDPAAALLSRFARAVAFAALGDIEQAGAERAAFAVAMSAIPAGALYRSNPIERLRPVFEATVEARLAAASSPPAAVTAWERAVAAQDRLEYHEPPPFYYPLRESLGAALLAAGRSAEAERVFREELVQHPASGRALFGLWHALEARGAAVEVARVHQAFLQAWAGSDVELSLRHY
jgi:hypothetical protein